MTQKAYQIVQSTELLDEANKMLEVMLTQAGAALSAPFLLCSSLCLCLNKVVFI